MTVHDEALKWVQAERARYGALKLHVERGGLEQLTPTERLVAVSALLGSCLSLAEQSEALVEAVRGQAATIERQEKLRSDLIEMLGTLSAKMRAAGLRDLADRAAAIVAAADGAPSAAPKEKPALRLVATTGDPK